MCAGCIRVVYRLLLYEDYVPIATGGWLNKCRRVRLILRPNCMCASDEVTFCKSVQNQQPSKRDNAPLHFYRGVYRGGVATRRLEIKKKYISVLKSQKAIQKCYIKRAYTYVGREGSVVGRMKTVELNNMGGGLQNRPVAQRFL